MSKETPSGWAGFIHPAADAPDMARAAALVISRMQAEQPKRLRSLDPQRVLNAARDNGLILHTFPASIH